MNPPTSLNPAVPRPALDLTRPKPAPAAAPANNAGLTTNIVENIPMHAPAQPALQPAPKAVSEDDELDHIMQDIGHELKQADRKTTKKHFSLFSRKHQAPASRPSPLPAPRAAQPAAAAAPAPQPAIPATPAQPAAAAAPAAKAAPTKTSSAPVGIIFMTILVTGALIAAAIYSYK